MLLESETWPVWEEDVIRWQRHDARMVRWMCSVRPEDEISAEELQARLKFNRTRECLITRLQWFSHLQRMGDSVWTGKWKAFNASGFFPEEDLPKHGMR